MNEDWDVLGSTRLTGRLNGFGDVEFANGANLVLNKAGNSVSDIDLSFNGSGSLEIASGRYMFNRSNTFSGDLKLSGGELIISSGSKTGALQNTIVMDGGKLSLTDSAHLAAEKWQIEESGATLNTKSFEVDISGDISGSGQLKKTGSGSLTLTGNNSDFSGEIIVDGRLYAGAGDSLGNETGVTLNNANLTLQGNENFGSLAGNGSFNLITFNAKLVDDKHTTFSGIVTGSGNLTHDGDGSLRLNGSLENFGGDLKVDQGNLVLENFVIGDFAQTATTESDGTLTFDTAGQNRSFTGSLVNRGRFVKSGAGTLTINDVNKENGTVEITGGVLASNRVFADNLILNGGTYMPTTNNQTFDSIVALEGSSGTLEIGVDAFRTRDGLSGNGTIAKTGNGEFSFFSSADNSGFTGTFAVQQGTLRLSRDIAAGNVNVGASGFLTVNRADKSIGSLAGSGSVLLTENIDGDTVELNFGGNNNSTSFSGRIEGLGNIAKRGTGDFNFSGDAKALDGEFNVVEGSLSGTGNFSDLVLWNTGTLTPGNSAGQITVENLTLESGSSLELELGGLEAAIEFDQLIIEQDFSVAGQLEVSLINGHELDFGQHYIVASVGGNLLGEFDGLAEGELVGNFSGQDLFITYAAGDGNDVGLFTLSAVPEPSAITVLMLFLAGYTSRRRRRLFGSVQGS